MGKDFLAEVIRRLLECSGPDAIRKEEIKIRQQWGGERVYVQKAPTAGKTQRLAEGLAAGHALRDVFESAGVSRRWGYRLISRRR